MPVKGTVGAPASTLDTGRGVVLIGGKVDDESGGAGLLKSGRVAKRELAGNVEVESPLSVDGARGISQLELAVKRL
jgi:hypothetical protein